MPASRKIADRHLAEAIARQQSIRRIQDQRLARDFGLGRSLTEGVLTHD